MGRANECCNPLNKEKHKCVRKNLILIKNKRNDRFKSFVGFYMCVSCERAIYNGRKLVLKNDSPRKQPVNVNDKMNNEEDREEDSVEISDDDYNEKADPTFECKSVDNALQTEKVNSLLLKLGEPPIKKKPSTPLTEKQKQIVAMKVANNLLNNDSSGNNGNDIEAQQYISNIKTALLEQNSRLGKIQILTTLPSDWSSKKIRREFQVSRRMVTRAKRLREKSGFAAQPEKRKGKNLKISTRDEVIEFYLSDNISRMMPGMKDFVSIVKDGQKCQVQKKLLLFNLEDVYKQFKETHPNAKIGLTKFRKLRPPQCILAGQSGTHNVCVCKTHQNIKLKLSGVKQALKNKGAIFDETYNDFIKNSTCEKSTSSCFLSSCKKCPGISHTIEKLKTLLDDHEINEITYSQWTSTDRYIASIYFKIISIFRNIYRCDIEEKTDKKHEFLDSLSKDWPELLKHDFLAKSQAAYFTKKKESTDVGEFVVCLDFAENYTFHVQNAIQSYHWTNTQATLHPYVIYYRENQVKKHLNYVIISEKTTHDTSSVHLFNCKLVEYLKQKFSDNNVKKLYYFSDGAGSQYKNKYNFVNLCNHQVDFKVDAEWNFFATSHGKGACDGVGGTVKRHAYRSSLQRDDNNFINTPKKLFDWAKDFFNKIDFGFCSVEEHDTHNETLKVRFEQAVTIKDTRQFHQYKAINQEYIECRIFSENQKVVKSRIEKQKKNK